MKPLNVEVVHRHVEPHPCSLPRWRQRRKLRIGLGDRVRCTVCGQVWEWRDSGWETEWVRWPKGAPAGSVQL